MSECQHPNLDHGCVHCTEKDQMYQKKPFQNLIHHLRSSTLLDNSKERLPQEHFTTNSSRTLDERWPSEESKQLLNPGWQMLTDWQPTLSMSSDAEEPLNNAWPTVPSKTPEWDSDSSMELSPSFQSLEENFLPFLEAEERSTLLTPLGMTCCCDLPGHAWRNCGFLLHQEVETPLIHLFVKSIMDHQDQESPKPSFNRFRQLILNHLENGGIITPENPSSFLMTLMDLSFRLVISNDGLTDTLASLKLKVAHSPLLQLIGSSQRTSGRLIGGLKRSLDKMAETLYGVAFLQWCVIVQMVEPKQSIQELSECESSSD